MDRQHTTNRNHKDRLFKFIFNDKEELLKLYNAINHTDYDNPEDLIINTIDNVIYMGMKNDLSFLIYGILNLYEHQSTWNPNMPIRNLIYVVDLYKGYIKQNGYDLYGSRRIILPTPQAVVFYNGEDEEPERKILNLSEAYEVQGKEHCLEFSTVMLNINYGKNKELMERCRPLMEYAMLINRIREYTKQEIPVEIAIDRAVQECIKDGILAKLLSKHRSEVTRMILEEYDEQAHINNEKKWSEEEGIIIGSGRINQLNQRLEADGRINDLLRACKDAAFQEKLLEEYGLK